MKRLMLMIAVLVSAAYIGCKQSDGDRCQVDDDCASGVCNKAKGTCSGGGDESEFDAGVPDGPPIDAAPPADAPPDA